MEPTVSGLGCLTHGADGCDDLPRGQGDHLRRLVGVVAACNPARAQTQARRLQDHLFQHVAQVHSCPLRLLRHDAHQEVRRVLNQAIRANHEGQNAVHLLRAADQRYPGRDVREAVSLLREAQKPGQECRVDGLVGVAPNAEPLVDGGKRVHAFLFTLWLRPAHARREARPAERRWPPRACRRRARVW